MASGKISRDTAFEIGRLDAHDQAALARAGAVSLRELTEAAIIRTEALDPLLNALSHRAFETAVATAETLERNAAGAMAGVPYLIKDSALYPGMPTRSGSRSSGDTPATMAYPFLTRLSAAGLVPLGKTTMPEFGLLPSNESVLYGPTHNPWHPQLSTGGSSGGAGAAVAAGLVPIAHASDAGGSIRIPASCCGLVGLKASRGANVRARPRHLFDDILCSDGLLTRTVRDAAWGFAAAHPRAGTLPVTQPIARRLRIGVALHNAEGAMPHPQVVQVIERTARLCEDLGHHVEPIVPPVDAVQFAESFKTLWAYLGGEVRDSCASQNPGRAIHDLIEPWPIGLAEWADTLDGLALERTYRLFGEVTPAYEQQFETLDVILSPVLSEPAIALGRLAGTRPWRALLDDMMRLLAHTPIHNVTGNPSISLPVFTGSDGMPIGSMFSAARDADPTLLALALEIEMAAPWADRWPDISVGEPGGRA